MGRENEGMGVQKGHERPKYQGNDFVGYVSGVDEFDAEDEPHDACYTGAGDTNSLATGRIQRSGLLSIGSSPKQEQN